MPQFILKIELGNEGIQTGYDLAMVLQEIGEDIYAHYETTPIQNIPSEQILDINGNVVGHYEVRE